MFCITKNIRSGGFMPTTAYSKTFNGEFQVDQLENLHTKFKDHLKLDTDFRAFVKSDVLCPCCNTSNAIVVSQGFSKASNEPVKQAHFALKNNDGLHSHLKFCDFYSGLDKEILTTNECMVRLRESNDMLTETVRRFICAGIENNVFSQKDILAMRQWFFELKSTKSLFVKESKLKLKLLHQMIINKERNKKQFSYSNDPRELIDIDIDAEALKLLSFRAPVRSLPDPKNIKENWIYYSLRSKTVIEKAIKISIKDDQTYTYDRTLLKENYKKSWHVAYKIVSSVPELFKKYGRSTHTKVRKLNSIMAYAALLLFINKWDIEASLSMHNERIAPIDKIINMNLGNVIGINPFMNYAEWDVLKFVDVWTNQSEGFDMTIEFNKAKTDVLEHYGK